jgi:hypothetical protein
VYIVLGVFMGMLIHMTYASLLRNSKSRSPKNTGKAKDSEDEGDDGWEDEESSEEDATGYKRNSGAIDVTDKTMFEKYPLE